MSIETTSSEIDIGDTPTQSLEREEIDQSNLHEGIARIDLGVADVTPLRGAVGGGLRQSNSLLPSTPQVSTVVNVNFQTVRLASTDPEAIRRFHQNRLNAEDRGILLNRDEYIDPPVKTAILLGFHEKKIKNTEKWTEMTDETFFRNMHKCFGEIIVTTKNTSDLDLLIELIKKITYDFDPTRTSCQWSPYVIEFEAAKATYPIPTSDEGKVVTAAVENLRHSDEKSRFAACVIEIKRCLTLELSSLTTLQIYYQKLVEWSEHVKLSIAEVRKFQIPAEIFTQAKVGGSQRERPRKGKLLPYHEWQEKQADKVGKRKASAGEEMPAAYTKKAKDDQAPCKGCGKNHNGVCKLESYHPDYNHSSLPWKDSEVGKKWAEHSKFPSTTLPARFTLDGRKWNEDKKCWEEHNDSVSKQDKQEKGKGKNKKACKPDSTECLTCQDCNTLAADNDDNFTVPVKLLTTTHALNTRILVDTGALHANYISEQIATELADHGAKVLEMNAQVCSALEGQCSKCKGKLKLRMQFCNDITNEIDIIQTDFTIVDMRKRFDVIIGRPSIIEHGLLQKFYKHFTSNHGSPTGGSQMPSLQQGRSVFCEPDHLQETSPVSRIQTLSQVWQVEHMSRFIDKVDDTDGIPFVDEETPWQRVSDGEEPTSGIPRDLNGREEFKERQRMLCEKYLEIFSTELRDEPADIPPMEIKFDPEKWQSMKANRLPPRIQSPLKQEETRRQMDVMTTNNVIKPAPEAPRWGQWLLVPKPNGKWRGCADLEALNKCSELPGWPLPRIPDLLQRIGTQKPKFFGVMDLTNGYHQAPLAKGAQLLTAFITFMGIFKYLRVPMGVKGAPAYFQMIMATVVLSGLIHIICECYQDDIIVFGKTEDDFLQRLEEVFKRLRKHKLTVNPEKCHFGLTQIEYVGHVISGDGITISAEKRDAVFDIDKPILAKHLKSFIGCAEYFHMYVRDFSATMRPLHQMVTEYDRNRKLVWTEEAERSWNKIREDIRACPTLYFLDPTAPIYLHTDASDYGIGAYLFQVIDGVHKPIAFMSKSLSGAELRWSTIEKECYAIVYALKKFEYLLRDCHFTLRTDHKNLLYVNTAHTSKVARWKLLIQAFDFDLEYLKGEENFVADSFSRLVPFLGGEEYHDLNPLSQLDEFKIPRDKYKIISQAHNSVVGHFGVDKTMSKVTEVDPKTGKPRVEPWIGMREHVKCFIRKCPICQKLSQSKVKVLSDTFTTASYEPMERLNIDTIGPLQVDELGNCWIIVIIDCFTRWVELIAVPDNTAKSAARALLNHIGRYGQPHQIKSDNGPSYAANIIAELVDLLGTEHVFTVPYSHEENAIVERANKEVMRHLRALVFDTKTIKSWSQNLPIVQRIMNTQVHESIGTAPALLLLGNASSLDSAMFVPEELRPADKPLSEWAAERLEQQRLLLECAKKTQEERDLSNMHKRRAKRKHSTETDNSEEPDTVAKETSKNIRAKTDNTITNDFAVGAYVLVDYPENSLGRGRPPHKLMMPRRGPFEVVAKYRGSYSLRDLATGTVAPYNAHLLRPYHYDPELDDPREAALKEKQMYTVEAIREHRGNARRVSTLEFLVKWQDYKEADNSWEPWANLRTNARLHEYLRQHGLQNLIPRQFRVQAN